VASLDGACRMGIQMNLDAFRSGISAARQPRFIFVGSICEPPVNDGEFVRKRRETFDRTSKRTTPPPQHQQMLRNPPQFHQSDVS